MNLINYNCNIMKKFLLLIALCSVSFMAFANEPEVEGQQSAKAVTASPSSDFTHWSLAVGGGVSEIFHDGSFKSMYTNEGGYQNLNRDFNWQVNVRGQYMVNPMWGVQLQFMFNPTSSKMLSNEGFSDIPYLQKTRYTFNAEFVLNLLNCFRRSRVHTNWNWYATVGAGFTAFYSQEHEAFRPGFLVPIGTEVEYNPIKALGIFIDAKVSWFADERIYGSNVNSAVNLDCYVGAGLKVHFGSSKKPHVTSVDMCTYEPQCGGRRAKSDEDKDEEINELKDKVSELSKIVDEMKKTPVIPDTEKKDFQDPNSNPVELDKAKDFDKQIKRLDDRIDNVENEMNKWQRTPGLARGVEGDVSEVYFEFNSSRVTPEYEIKLAKVAKNLLQDSKLRVRVVGHTDKEGTPEYNKALAQRRIDAVVTILCNRYRLERSRIVIENQGKASDDSPIDELDRRCDVIYLHM